MITSGTGSFTWVDPLAATQMAGPAPAVGTVEATPGATRDVTVVTGAASPLATAPTTNPWPEMERLGLMGAGRTQGGPLGQALGQVARQGLLDAFTRLEAAGVKFERERTFRIPGLMDRYVPQTPEQVVSRLERKPFESTHLSFNHGAESHETLWSVDDLRTLDAAYGLGPAAAKPEIQPAFPALADLRAAGWSARDGRNGAELTPFGTWRQLGRGGVSLAPASGDGCTARRADDLVTLDYLVTGKDRGLADRALADALLSLQPESPQYAGGNDGRGPLDAYRALTTQGHSVDVTFDGRPIALTVDRADFANPGSIVERSKKLDALWRNYLKPAVGDNHYYASPFLKFCIEDNQRFTPELRSAVTAHLISSWQDGARASECITGMVRRMEAMASDDVQLAWIANRIASTARREGTHSAMQALDTLADGPLARTTNAAEAERLRPILFEMVDATHSTAAAVEGLDLIRIAVGSETEDQRLKLFTDIAARESDKTLANTADDYRAVLVHRRAGEDLLSAGATFVRVLETVALNRQQERAVEVFATLQDGMTRGSYGQRSMDDVLGEFAQNLTMAKSIEDAMRKLSGGSHGIPAGPSSVETRDDAVVIGGIRVPRARTGQE